jgi:hypothetical protein
MKSPSTFWPILRNELALFRYGYPGWMTAAFLVFYTAMLPGLLFLLMFRNDSVGNDNLALLLQTGIIFFLLVIMLVPVMFVMLLSTIPALKEFFDLNSSTGANPPIPLPPVGTTEGFEFMFTRAMDRVMLCRARTAAFFILALLPFFVALAAAPFTPDIRLNLNHTPAGRLDAQISLYSHAFPAMRPLVNGQRSLPGQFTVPGGTVAYTVWLGWIAALTLLFCHSYGMLLSRWAKPNSWWTLTPLVLPFLIIFCLIKFTFAWQEQSFLFFVAHLLPMIAGLIALAIVIQLWSERRFRKMEIL